MSINDKMKKYRETAGLSTLELADKIGATEAAVISWESGEVSPPVNMLLAIAGVYNVGVDAFLGADSTEDKAVDADEIADADENYDYDKKYKDTYAKYGFGAERTNDRNSEYNSNISYGDMSNNEAQEWKGTRTGGWLSFFRSIPYPLICVVIYLIVGFAADAWHPGWIIFLTVAPYYTLLENYATTGKVIFPILSITVITYLLMGFLGGLWLMGLFVFIALPLYFCLNTLMRVKNSRVIVFGFFCIVIYLTLGFTLKLWSSAWIVFLTIPIVESIYIAAAKLIKEKKEEKDNKKPKFNIKKKK